MQSYAGVSWAAQGTGAKEEAADVCGKEAVLCSGGRSGLPTAWKAQTRGDQDAESFQETWASCGSVIQGGFWRGSLQGVDSRLWPTRGKQGDLEEGGGSGGASIGHVG